MPTITDGTTAIVLAIGDGWFAYKSDNGALTTSRSVAGAATFGPWQEGEIQKAERFIASKGQTSERRTLSLVPRDPTA